MKLQASEDGFITALRFYKQPNNTGRHVGHLWTAAGEQLAEVEFTGETASGWQAGAAADPDPDRRRPAPTSRPTTRPTAASPSAPASSSEPHGTSRRWPPPALSNGVYPLRRQRASRTRRSTPPTTGSTRRSTRTRPRRHAAAARRELRRPPPAPRASRPDAKVDRHVRRAGRPADRQQRLVRPQGRRRRRPSRRTSTYDATTRKATLTPAAAARVRQDLHGDGQGRQRRRRRPRRATGPPPTATGRSARPPSARARSSRPTQAPSGQAVRDQPRRARRALPPDRGRLHHRAALLQAVQQQRHAHRPPVVRRRAAARDARPTATRPPRAGRRPSCPNPVAVTKDTTYVSSYHSSLRLLRVRAGRPGQRR